MELLTEKQIKKNVKIFMQNKELQVDFLMHHYDILKEDVKFEKEDKLIPNLFTLNINFKNPDIAILDKNDLFYLCNLLSSCSAKEYDIHYKMQIANEWLENGQYEYILEFLEASLKALKTKIFITHKHQKMEQLRKYHSEFDNYFHKHGYYEESEKQKIYSFKIEDIKKKMGG